MTGDVVLLQPAHNQKETEMRKFLIVLMTLALLVGASKVFADADSVAYTGGLGMGTLRAVTLVNNSDTGYDSTIVSSTYIPARQCQLLGYTASAIATTNLEGLFDIRDASNAATGLDTTIIAESEVTASLPLEVIYPKPLEILNGISVHQGPKTCVTIYYIQVR